MNIVSLAASGGKVYLYHLPTALTNEQQLAKSKLKMGVEKELVYNFLNRASALDFEEKMTQGEPSLSNQEDFLPKNSFNF
jgi:hypothetical protein